jgi:drug/metabolite transporter (DMT)-like permease
MNKNLLGVGSLVLAILIFSLQDIAVKWMGGSYPVLEIVILRTIVAMPATLFFFRMEGGKGLPTTKRYKLEFLRGLFYFLSYTTYFMGLAALPLAEIAAIKFSTPLMITLLSVILLREKVRFQRWMALIVGFIGVLIIIRPGSASFKLRLARLHGHRHPFGPARHRGWPHAERQSEPRLSLPRLEPAHPGGFAHHGRAGTGLGRRDVFHGPRLQPGAGFSGGPF